MVVQQIGGVLLLKVIQGLVFDAFHQKILFWSEMGMLIEDMKDFFVLGWDQLNFHYVKVDMNGPAKFLFTQQRMKK